MVIPLAVIAFGMFAAVLVPYGYPLQWMTVTMPLEDLSPFLTVHVVSAILAVMIALAARKDVAPGLGPALVALAGILAMTVMTVIAVKTFSDGGHWTAVLVFVAPVALAVVLSFNALRVRGWERMLILLGAFAVAGLPYSCPLVPGMYNLFSSGLVYLAAQVTVLALFVRGMRWSG
ncbi:MAG: hypothetical protein ACKV2T_01425 [Kofleriaceae bacterium]